VKTCLACTHCEYLHEYEIYWCNAQNLVIQDDSTSIEEDCVLYATKRETIIDALTHCKDDNCTGCPYGRGTTNCLGDLHNDALRLIMEDCDET
jgi:hypothetical protein